MSVNEVYRASMIFNDPLASGDIVVTSHYRTSSVIVPISNPAEALEIAVEVVGAVNNDLLGLLSTTMTFTEVNVIGITDPFVGVTQVAGGTGSATGEALPMRSSPVVRLNTELRGRSFQGRMFLPTPTEINQAGGVLVPAYITAANIFIAAMQILTGATSGNTYRQTVYSRTLSTPPTIVVDNLVISSTLNATMGSQRRRQTV